MRDPVCGMTVEKGRTVDGYPGVVFCSEHCRDLFVSEPHRYLDEAITPSRGRERPVEVSAYPPARGSEQVAGSESIHLAVEGMTCASCVSTVERL